MFRLLRRIGGLSLVFDALDQLLAGEFDPVPDQNFAGGLDENVVLITIEVDQRVVGLNAVGHDDDLLALLQGDIDALGTHLDKLVIVEITVLILQGKLLRFVVNEIKTFSTASQQSDM